MRNSISNLTEHNSLDELKLLEIMMNAIATEEISSKIGTGMNIVSKLLSVASLIPGVNVAVGAGSLTLDYLNSQRKDLSPHCLSLLPEVQKNLSKYRLEKRYNQLKEIHA